MKNKIKIHQEQSRKVNFKIFCEMWIDKSNQWVKGRNQVISWNFLVNVLNWKQTWVGKRNKAQGWGIQEQLIPSQSHLKRKEKK